MNFLAHLGNVIKFNDFESKTSFKFFKAIQEKWKILWQGTYEIEFIINIPYLTKTLQELYVVSDDTVKFAIKWLNRY